jgi:hypothetical protein
MAAFATYSTTPSANTTCGGVSVAEDCAAGNVNDAIRQILSEGKQLNALVAAVDTTTLLPKAGGTVTGDITRSGKGVYRYNADSTLVNGATYFLATGSSRPTAAEGVVVFYY